MKKKLLLIFTAVILATSAVSCKDTSDTLPENPTNSEVEIGTTVIDNGKTESGNTEIDNPPETPNAPEVSDTPEVPEAPTAPEAPESSEPTPEHVKDTYTFEAVSEDAFEIVGELVDSSEFAIFTVDGGAHVGVCDINGKTIVNPDYTVLGWCPWHEVVYAEPFPEGTAPVVISDKYRIDVHYGHGGFGKTSYVFDENAGKMFTVGADIEVFYVDEVETIPVNTPYICYSDALPITSGEVYYDGTEGGLYAALEAVMYGEAKYETITEKGSIVDLGKCENVGYFKNDFLLLSRGGKYGLVNLLGKDACEFKYTSALPAYDSKAWVKTENDGWKVVNLKGV